MILQKMTPEEKIAEAKKIISWLDETIGRWVDYNMRVLKKRKTYPFCPNIKRKLDNFGEWNITLYFSAKPKNFKSIYFTYDAWQKFFVSRSDKVENIGAGLYLLGGNSQGGIIFSEFTPHFINRFKERYFLRQGKKADFLSIVNELLEAANNAIQCESTKLIERYIDKKGISHFIKIPHYKGYDNFSIFLKQGLCLGIQRRNEYYCFLTFIGEEELFDNQKEIMTEAEKIMEERRRWKETTPEQRKKNMTKLLQYFQSLKETGNSNNSATLPLPLISF